MPRGGAHFSSEELAKVLSHYEIGVIHQAKALSVGSRRVPKMLIVSEQGKFLLKRRLKGRDDLDRVAFAHSVQTHLAGKSFSVAPLVPTCDAGSTFLQLNNHIYEFFRFVKGVRYTGSSKATTNAGRQLARFHDCLKDFMSDCLPPRSSFHDSSVVRRHLKTVGSDKRAGADRKLQAVSEVLMIIYNDSSVRVNELGFDLREQQVIHGDWHPGNLLFSDDEVVSVVDFDSVRIAPPIIDLANGMLQFSIVGGRPNLADWPDYFDQKKLLQFLAGYRECIELDKAGLESLLDLMIETMIAEAVLPVAATGFFGNLSGLGFLEMILRKATWLNRHRKKLTETINA